MRWTSSGSDGRTAPFRTVSAPSEAPSSPEAGACSPLARGDIGRAGPSLLELAELPGDASCCLEGSCGRYRPGEEAYVRAHRVLLLKLGRAPAGQFSREACAGGLTDCTRTAKGIRRRAHECPRLMCADNSHSAHLCGGQHDSRGCVSKNARSTSQCHQQHPVDPMMHSDHYTIGQTGPDRVWPLSRVLARLCRKLAANVWKETSQVERVGPRITDQV